MTSWLRIGKDPSAHYDDISDAWRFIFGDNFHFGFFESPEDSLDHATEALIDRLGDLGSIGEQSKVLDIGCGVGAPASYLHQKFRCSILGISTSQRGIAIANAAAESKKIADRVSFLCADGTQTGLGDRSFDLVWVLEASHLMDKRKLFREAYRLLKPKGQLLLCDIVLVHPLQIKEQLEHLLRLKMRYITGYLAMKQAFARGKVASFSQYYDALAEARFNEVKIIDISQNVIPTLDRWRTNVGEKRAEISRTLSDAQVNTFLRATGFVEHLFLSRVLGYGLISATKRN